MKQKNLNEQIKQQVADLIINFNLLESKLADIIAFYISSPKNHFVREVLLNSLTLSFNSKLNILKYIIKTEKITPSQDFYKSIKIVIAKRNTIAHSDRLLNIEDEIIDLDVDWNRDGILYSPIFQTIEPSLQIINDGEINYENINKVVNDFSKHYNITVSGLDKIQLELLSKNNNKVFGV